MKTLLVDDEPHNCELMETLLQLHLKGEVEVVGHAHSVEEAATILRKIKVDLVFLDIQMPSKNGFELISMFQPLSFEVIFITSFDQYALPAIQADAVSYLLKPVDIKELKYAVKKASKLNLLRELNDENIRELKNKTTIKIAVHEGDKVVYLSTSEIMYLEAKGRYTKITLSSGKSHTVAKHLKVFEADLESSNSFIKINRSMILHIKFVSEYSKSEPFIVTLKNGLMFEISRRRRQEIIACLRENSRDK